MRQRSPGRLALLAGIATIAAAADRPPPAATTFMNADAPLQARLDDLVGRMTLEEKAAQMQNVAPAIPRLGVPAYDYWNEALHGVARAGEATVFPQAIGMAATFDRDLLKAEGQTVAIEARAKYNQAQRDGNRERYFGLTFWSPNINIFRDPRWGRGQETLGEDPYLTGVLGTAFIQGVQGDDPRYLSAIATPKHFAVHSGPEPLRHGFNVDPSPRDLAETYLPAFRRAVTEGHAQSLMCAYNAVGGQAACASPMLLRQTLRRDWGFTGFVTSDCGAIDDITTGHHQSRTNVEGAALAVKAGTDTGCDFKDEMLDLPKAVKGGLIDEATIDVAVKRLFAARLRLGLFDPPTRVPFAAIPYAENHSAAHRALALRAARESIVLLKNDGALPLVAGAARIAVVGAGATSLIGLEGNYNGTPVAPVLPLDGIEAAFGRDHVSYAQGAPFTAEIAAPVPRTAFGAGLTATFYNSPDLSGPAVATRPAREIDVNWDGVAPAPGVDPHVYSVRWSGTIAAPAAGDYVFELDTHRCDVGGGAESYVIRIAGSDPLRVDSSCGARGEPHKRLAVHFADTSPHAFSLEFAHRSGRSGSLSLSWTAPALALRDEALRNAAKADVVIMFAGLNAWLEGEEMPLHVPGFDGGDRTAIGLPDAQETLLKALVATGKPVIVVLQSGSAVALEEGGAKARAVLQAWYPGEAGGTAIADILSGKVSPSGRLPVSFYASTAALPPFTDYSMSGRTYRYATGGIPYPFGYGLSYTRFAYSKPVVASRNVVAGHDQTVRVTVRNIGQTPADEVAQLYLTIAGRPSAPRRSLKGFQRVHLAVGESRVLTFTLNPRDLALADEAGVMRVTPATYKLWVGGGQPGTSAAGGEVSFSTTGRLALAR